MSNVIEADFTAQVVHLAGVDDSVPLCGADPEGAFIVERGQALKSDMRLCGACHRTASGEDLYL